MNIDLSQFNNVDLGEEKYTSTYRMQQVNELNQSIDSLEKGFAKDRIAYGDNIVKLNLSDNLAIATNEQRIESLRPSDSIFSLYQDPLKFVDSKMVFHRIQIVSSAQSNVKSLLRNLGNKKRLFFVNQKRINLHKNTLHEKYTLGFGIFFLFLVGASLGAIIRKGGLGLPMVLAILIFLTYHYIGLFGRNAAEDSSLSPFVGSWLSIMIIAPFAFYFTQRASTDKGLVNYDFLIVSTQGLLSSLKERTFARLKMLWKKRN